MNDELYQNIIRGMSDKGSIHLVEEIERLNRPEDGYQPSLDAKINYFVNDKLIYEKVSIEDSSYGLKLEIEKNLDELSEMLIKDYWIKREGNRLLYKNDC